MCVALFDGVGVVWCCVCGVRVCVAFRVLSVWYRCGGCELVSVQDRSGAVQERSGGLPPYWCISATKGEAPWCKVTANVAMCCYGKHAGGFSGFLTDMRLQLCCDGVLALIRATMQRRPSCGERERQKEGMHAWSALGLACVFFGGGIRTEAGHTEWAVMIKSICRA
jgi:hypothetical protein